MSGPCPTVTDGAFLESALAFVDCQAQSIGSLGYQALAAPGSPVSLGLTALLTLFVAFFGYRMLFGQVPGVRDGVLALVKIGIVLALATSWAAYRTVIYDVTFHGPAELSAQVGGAAGVPGASGRLVERLGRVDAAFLELGRLGAGPGQLGTANRSGLDGQNILVPVPASDPPNIFSPFALGSARLVFLISTIAGFASVRLIAGLLLALGPLFVAFLLFEGTRGLFEGWIRGLVAAALGALVVSVLIGVELALLEPWLANLIALRQAELPLGGAPTELLVVAFSFAFVLIAGLGVAARVALGFRLPATWREMPARLFYTMRDEQSLRPASAGGAAHVPSEQHSRAAVVAEAIATMQRRETAQAGGSSPSRAATMTAGRGTTFSSPTPLGQSQRRRTQSRISASAGRRDNKR